MNTVNIALRRQVMTLEYFTSGTVPDALIGVPRPGARTRSRPTRPTGTRCSPTTWPPGGAPRFVPARSRCTRPASPSSRASSTSGCRGWCASPFSISPQALDQADEPRSADTQKELAEEEGLAPLLDWIKGVLDEVIADDLAAPELEFAWQEDEQIDEAAQAERLRGLTRAG